MKKILTCGMILLLCLLTMTSCKSKKTDATKAVEAMIKEIGAVSLDSEEQLNEIESAYSALSVAERERVKNYDDYKEAQNELKAIKTRFKSYEEMNNTISKVIAAAASTYTENDISYTDLLASGEAILEQYKDLDKEAKENVNVSEDFEAAVETLKGLVSNSEQSAAEYVKAFYTVFEEENYEVTNVYCIKQIRDGTEYNIFALTYQDADGNEHNIYANARCSADAKAEILAENKDSFFARIATSEIFNAVTHGNVPIDVETVLKLAK